MSFLLKLLILSRKISGALCLSIFVFFSMGNAQATTIDFDDLNQADFIGDEGYIPLTNQYESLGVIFEGGAYLSNYSRKSLNSIDGPGFSLYFIHELPTYVSMYVGSGDQLKVGVSVYGLDGHRETKVTDGWVRGMSQEQSTPYSDNQFVSFFVEGGISHIHLGSQQTVYMDNLSFNVPEPATWLLFGMGALALLLRFKRY